MQFVHRIVSLVARMAVADEHTDAAAVAEAYTMQNTRLHPVSSAGVSMSLHNLGWSMGVHATTT